MVFQKHLLERVDIIIERREVVIVFTFFFLHSKNKQIIPISKYNDALKQQIQCRFSINKHKIMKFSSSLFLYLKFKTKNRTFSNSNLINFK